MMRRFHAAIFLAIASFGALALVSDQDIDQDWPTLPVCVSDSTMQAVWRRQVVLDSPEYLVVSRHGKRELLRKKSGGPLGSRICSHVSQVFPECSADGRCVQKDEVREPFDQGLLMGAFRFYRGGATVRKTVHFGIGCGITPTWIERHCPEAEVLAAELSTEVWSALPYFMFENTTRKTSYLMDGRKLVEAQENNSTDMIFMDAQDNNDKIPGCLLTSEFFRNIYDKLVPGGVLVINSVVFFHPRERAQILATLRSAFPNDNLFTAVDVHLLPRAGRPASGNQYWAAVKPGGSEDPMETPAAAALAGEINRGIHFDPVGEDAHEQDIVFHDAEVCS